MDDLYREQILEHYKRPHNWSPPLPELESDYEFEDANPLCGDTLKVTLAVDEDGTVTDVRFAGHGCAISQASASLMTTLLKGRTADEATATFGEFKQIVTTGQAPEEISDMAAFAGVHAYPARIKCATLAWHAALDALKQPDKTA